MRAKIMHDCELRTSGNENSARHVLGAKSAYYWMDGACIPINGDTSASELSAVFLLSCASLSVIGGFRLDHEAKKWNLN